MYVCVIGGRYGEVPIIANGNVRTWSDVQDNLSSTSADGIMSAEGLLDNPALFNGGVAVDALQLAEEYLDLVERHPTKMKCVVFHIRRMCRELLTSYQVGRGLNALPYLRTVSLHSGCVICRSCWRSACHAPLYRRCALCCRC